MTYQMSQLPVTVKEFRARAQRYRELAARPGSPVLNTQLKQWAEADEAAAARLEMAAQATTA